LRAVRQLSRQQQLTRIEWQEERRLRKRLERKREQEKEEHKAKQVEKEEEEEEEESPKEEEDEDDKGRNRQDWWRLEHQTSPQITGLKATATHDAVNADTTDPSPTVRTRAVHGSLPFPQRRLASGQQLDLLLRRWRPNDAVSAGHRDEGASVPRGSGY
jgi:hypothetical protein